MLGCGGIRERANVNRLLGGVCVHVCLPVTGGCVPQTDNSETSPALLCGQVKVWRQGRGTSAKYLRSTLPPTPMRSYHIVFLSHHHNNHVKYVIISPLIGEENDPKMDNVISHMCILLKNLLVCV